MFMFKMVLVTGVVEVFAYIRNVCMLCIISFCVFIITVGFLIMIIFSKIQIKDITGKKLSPFYMKV